MYWSITIKLVRGMIGVLLLLRMTGKTQMADLSPLDIVNTIVLGAFARSIIYIPDTRFLIRDRKSDREIFEKTTWIDSYEKTYIKADIWTVYLKF